MIANLGLVLKLKSQGKDIKITDGITSCYPLYGEDSVTVDVSSFEGPVAVSLIPWNFTEPVELPESNIQLIDGGYPPNGYNHKIGNFYLKYLPKSFNLLLNSLNSFEEISSPKPPT